MEALTIDEALAGAAQRAPDRVACSHGADEMLWADLASASASAAAALAQLGVGPGDRVGLTLPTSLEWVVAAFATWRVGATLVPVKGVLAELERRDLLAHADPTLVVGEVEAGAWRGPRLSAAELRLAARGRSSLRGDPARGAAGPESVAVLAYTSGTTGRPRGVTWTHEAVLWAARHRVEPSLLEGRTLGHVVSLWIPGAIVALVNGVLGSARNALVSVGPGAMLQALAAEGIEYMGSSAALLRQVAECEHGQLGAPLRLREVLYGGSHTEPWVVDRLQELLGCDLVRAYGMTETTTVGTRLGPEMHAAGDARRDERLHSVGMPVEGLAVALVDGAGAHVPRGAVGEVRISSPAVTRGHWRDAAADAAVLVDGWVRTGDLGRIDDEGLLHLVGRAKDLIKVSGATVYAAEVERALAAHPAIAEAAVVGVPDPASGEAIVAALRLRPGSSAPGPAELAAYLAPRLAGYKQPARVRFVGDLPRNAAGKVDKAALRDELGS